MVTKYTILDNEKKKLLILRPYQIHAICAMREASKQGSRAIFGIRRGLERR